MTVTGNAHTHTQWCDGRDTMAAMVRAAYGCGMTTLGFSPHGPAHYDGAAMEPGHWPRYLAEAARLRARYRGRMHIGIGVEWDALEPLSVTGVDYVLGSVHHIRDGCGAVHCLDYTVDRFGDAVAAMGGAQPLVEAYADTYLAMLAGGKAHIAGHMDILHKINSQGRFFDPDCTWYGDVEERLAQAAARSGMVVEVNTAGLDTPWGHTYPGPSLLKRLARLGVPVMLSSDAHETGHIDRHFAAVLPRLERMGFRSIVQLGPGGMEPCPR